MLAAVGGVGGIELKVSVDVLRQHRSFVVTEKHKLRQLKSQ
jgi:hypothetical protein